MSRILVDQIRSNSASSDAITLDGSGNLTVPGNITCSGNATCSGTATGFGIGGKILQVKQTIKTDTSSNSSFGAGTAWNTDSFFSLDITPSATTSKIHITGKINVGVHEGNGIFVTLRVNGAVLSAATGDASSSRGRYHSLGYLRGYNIATSTYNIQQGAIDIPLDFLHSPSSTSQQTYSLELRTSHPGSSSGYINRSSNDDNVWYVPRAVSTITAMEVGA